MTINLEDWVNQGKCIVTLMDGTKHSVKIQIWWGDASFKYPYYWVEEIQGYTLRYFKSGKYYETKEEHIWDIIHIEELSMNTQQISEEINKVQARLEFLQAKLKQAETQEKINSEFFTPIEENSEYLYCLKFLKTKNVDCIAGGFDWANTPQGRDYWKDISNKETYIADYDIQQIKDWVINYLIQKDLRW